MENLVNLWYQSGKGGTKSKGKTQKKTPSKSTSTMKSKSNSGKTHRKKKYVMDEPNPELMKYPSYKRDYECKTKKCNKEWIKFDKCTKNVCHRDKFKQTLLEFEKNAIPLNQCIEDNCSKELKSLSQPRGKFNFKKFEKFQNCSNKKCGKENKIFQKEIKKLTIKKNSKKTKHLEKFGTCLMNKCNKDKVKYQNCNKVHCSPKTNTKKSKRQSSGKSKTKTATNYSNKSSKKQGVLTSNTTTKKTHIKPNFLNISRIKA